MEFDDGGGSAAGDRPLIDMKSKVREGRSYEEFTESHVGHNIHVVGPLTDEGCRMAVRVCVTCLVAVHISHRDATDPLTADPEGTPRA